MVGHNPRYVLQASHSADSARDGTIERIVVQIQVPVRQQKYVFLYKHLRTVHKKSKQYNVRQRVWKGAGNRLSKAILT